MAASSTNIPPGTSTCRLYLLDPKCDLVTPANLFIEPEIEGHKYLNLPDFGWLIVNEQTQEHVIFDLALRKDWENSTPLIAEIIRTALPGLNVQTDIPTLLEDNGIPLSTISTVIFSHWHFDHTGNMALFPKSTKAIFGPDWKDNFGTLYPSNPDSPYHAAEFEGREVEALDISKFDKEVAGFHAVDFFGDGSFYLLHAPGHTAEHMTALVRTTTDEGKADTFVVLGADSHHFPGMLRPTPQNALPRTFTPMCAVDLGKEIELPCPCTIWTSQHGRAHDLQGARHMPFYVPSQSGGYFLDHNQALDTLKKLQALDAMENVLVTIAHDPTLRGILPDINSGETINDWREKRYKQKTMWRWLKEMPRNGRPGMPLLVDGQFRHGKKIRDFEA